MKAKTVKMQFSLFLQIARSRPISTVMSYSTFQPESWNTSMRCSH